MEYIYDILVNFKDKYYDFFDWNKNDNIVHIRKIPLFKISKKDLYNIIKNKVKFDVSFLEKIENKTEIFSKNGVKRLTYSFLLSDEDAVIAINLNQRKYKISSLLIDEELDILEDIYQLDIQDIKYNIINKNDVNEFRTRKQLEEKRLLDKFLNKVDNSEKIKYLYYECFDKKEENINKIIVDLNNLEDEKTINKICNLLKLIEINK